ncbi:ATP-binding protein [Halobacterium sp. R2-5]|uniref:ATP-binding protein n=1 Tax=Halobacterium sp. R2-5 TaxID=2715751 RepID=UPI00142084A7|nr:ATP-binding protein [Halobacterium sp. R2-5]NIC00939.1 ATP-binding protein [Halobacterium sp. R2-5]
MSTEQEQQTDDSGLYCPHFQNVDEETLRRLFSKVAAVRSDDKELFDFTHRPIQVFRSPQGTQTEEEVVSEEQVYREFSDERVGNFTVVIEGEVGTGKSELCAYLAHRLEEDERPILHVDKDDDLMTLLSERIPEFYEGQFGEELPGASNFKQLREDLEQNGSVVANNATSGAILNLSARGYDIDVGDDDEEKIKEFVQDQLSLLVEKGEYAKEIKFVTEQAYRRNDFLQIVADSVDESEAVTAFNEELWREIRDRYQTASLDDVLERVGDRFTDTRPVIVFEDFAITAMEGQRLRNYMERDKSSDNWDFVVAGTRDSTQVLHTQTAEDRFEFYRTNRQNSNSVLFLDEDSAVDFIRPYLGYFKSFDGSVRYDRSGEGLEIELEPAPADSTCADCGFCDEPFRDLFPFNEPFLERVYRGLREDEQSPREYVMAVFDVLRDYYDGYVDAPSDAERLSTLTNSVDPATEIYEQADSVANLARWYGVPTEDGIEVDCRFVDVFGLQDTVAALDGVEESGGSVLVPTDNDVDVPPTNGGTTGGGTGNDIGTSGTTVERKSKAQRLIEEHRPNVQPWQQNPGDFPEISRYLRVGLRDAIERLTNDYQLFDGTTLRYNLSSQKDPFVFRSMARAPDEDQIVVDPEAFRISDLKKLLEFGVYREEDKSGADYAELLREMGTHLTGYARRWRTKVIEANLRSETRFFKKSADYEFEDFALAGYALVALLDSPFEGLSAETLSERFSDGTSYTMDSDLRAELQAELPPDEFEDLRAFVDNGQWFEDLVEGFYGANANTLDLAAVRDRIAENPPYEVLAGLGRGQIQRISPRVRFDTDSKIRDIADGAYDAQAALEEVESEYRADTVSVFTDELDAVSLTEIEDIVTTLRTYDSADAEMIESLSKFVALDQTDIDDAVAAAELASSLRHGSDQDRLHAVLVSMKLVASDVYQRYDDITIVGGGTVSGFATEFKRVGDHYVE